MCKLFKLSLCKNKKNKKGLHTHFKIQGLKMKITSESESGKACNELCSPPCLGLGQRRVCLCPFSETSRAHRKNECYREEGKAQFTAVSQYTSPCISACVTIHITLSQVFLLNPTRVKPSERIKFEQKPLLIKKNTQKRGEMPVNHQSETKGFRAVAASLQPNQNQKCFLSRRKILALTVFTIHSKQPGQSGRIHVRGLGV